MLEDLPVQSVLVVGAGNSGAEIALELVRAGKQVWLAGQDVGLIPANGPLGKFLGGRPIWWFMNHILTVNTPIERKVKASGGHHGTPLGRATRQQIAATGVELTPSVSGVESGQPQLEDGRSLSVEAVLWATGFRRIITGLTCRSSMSTALQNIHEALCKMPLDCTFWALCFRLH